MKTWKSKTSLIVQITDRPAVEKNKNDWRKIALRKVNWVHKNMGTIWKNCCRNFFMERHFYVTNVF